MISGSGMAAAGGVGGATIGADPRLKPAAHEFEACLMKEFLEPLQKDALFEDDGNGAGADGSESSLMSFGSEALARAISERGGFGIATKILEHFAAGKARRDAGPVLESEKQKI